MNHFLTLFGRSKHIVIGMVHVRALPGSPLGGLSMEQITEVACSEADVYNRAGVDAIMLENMFDVPWLRHDLMGPETTACLASVCSAVRRQHPTLPLGVQILAGANKEALAVAKAAGLNFIRAEGFVFSHIADKGPIHSCGAELLRYRRYLNAEDILVFTDIKKKHSSHAITGDVSLQETARAAALFRSDGVIVTGLATGAETNPQEVSDVQDVVKIPVLVGSGVTASNLSQYASAEGIIIGSHLKVEGHWQNDLDETRVKHFMEKVNDMRNLALKSASSNNMFRTDMD